MASIDVASRSPVSVVDCSLLLHLGKDERSKRFNREDTKPSPAGDSVTASTVDDTDSLSTLSMLSMDKESNSCSAESVDSCQSKRSIFAPYWEKTGQQPDILRRSVSYFPPRRAQHVAQESTKAAEDCPTSPGGRRSVLSKGCNSYASAPSLPSFDESTSCDRALSRRKTMSSGELRTSSCLRESRFSAVGAKRWSSERSSCSAVKFAAKVDVRHFEKPIEMYSPGDWSKHFMT